MTSQNETDNHHKQDYRKDLRFIHKKDYRDYILTIYKACVQFHCKYFIPLPLSALLDDTA